MPCQITKFPFVERYEDSVDREKTVFLYLEVAKKINK